MDIFLFNFITIIMHRLLTIIEMDDIKQEKVINSIRTNEKFYMLKNSKIIVWNYVFIGKVLVWRK